MSDSVFLWWCLLCAISAINIIAWVWSAAALQRHQELMSLEARAVCGQQLLFSAVYVFGCAFRSVLPVFDVPRIGLFHTWLSSALVGRSVATAAELCFVAQWALMLRVAAQVSGSTMISNVSRMLLPLIVAAEVCSWLSVLTTSNLGHVIEEAIWGGCAVLVVAALLVLYRRCPQSWRSAVLAGVVGGTGYAAYMFLVDVPRYWKRWTADQAEGQTYLTVMQGVADALQRRVVSHNWEVWQGEVVWMTLYFSVAVWVSIWLVHGSMVQVRAMVEKPQATARVPSGARRGWLRSKTVE
jgi:hypothetical protein